MQIRREQFQGVILGLAVGDALRWEVRMEEKPVRLGVVHNPIQYKWGRGNDKTASPTQ